MANNFSGDSRFKVLYRCESAALGNDSIGGNHLTVTGSAADTESYKEGSASIAFDAGEFGSRADADLGNDVPLKYGTSNKSLFVCFWIYPIRGDSSYYFSKYQATSGGRCFAIRADASNYVAALIGYNDGNSVDSTSLKHGTPIPAAGWYHIQVWFNDATHNGKIRIYRDGVGYLGSTKAITDGSLPSIHLNELEFCINAQSGSHADCRASKFDEIVIANTDDVSEQEADAIREQTFGAVSEDPVCTITSPTSNPTYDNGDSDTIDLAGTASDDVGVTEVTWSNDRGGSGTATGTTSWSISDITLYSGQNVITVTAHDADSNTGSDTITVTYTPSSGVTLDSNFDSGNGIAESPFESPVDTLNIYCNRDDADSNELTDWFYFSLDNVLGRTLTLNVDFYHWTTSYYGSANANVRPVWSYDQVTWNRLASASWLNGVLTFTLPQMTQNKVYIAMDTPYTYADLQAHIMEWSESPYCSSVALSYSGISSSQGGRNLYHLTIEEPGYYDNRLNLVITARSHPGEPQGSWQLKGFIDWILSSDPAAVTCRRKCKINIFPMTNPDGVFHGRTRNFNNHLDGNRGFDITGPDSETEPPETFLIHSKIHELRTSTSFCIDFHSNNYPTGGTYVPKIVYDATNDDWSASDINAVTGLLNSYDADDYWGDAWVNMPSDYTTGWRRGQIEQYGYHALGTEGGICKDNSGGYPSASDRETGGAVLVRSLIEALEESIIYVDLAGSLNTSSQLTASLKRYIGMAGSANFTFSAENPLKATRSIQGNIETSGALAGVTKATRNLLGTSETTSDLAASLKSLLGFSGAIDSRAEVAGFTSIFKTIIGAITAKADISAMLELSGTIEFSGSISTKGEMASNLRLKLALSGELATVPSLEGTVRRFKTLSGALEAVASIVGDAMRVRGFSGDIASATSIEGYLVRDMVLAGAIASSIDANGKVNIILSFSGSMDSLASLIASLSTFIPSTLGNPIDVSIVSVSTQRELYSITIKRT